MFDPKNKPPKTSRMFRTFIRIALPAMLTNLSAFTTVIVAYTFTGHMNDPVKLAALGLAYSVNSMLVVNLLIGLNAAQETLTSQAFGANNLRLCGVYLNRGSYHEILEHGDQSHC